MKPKNFEASLTGKARTQQRLASMSITVFACDVTATELANVQQNILDRVIQGGESFRFNARQTWPRFVPRLASFGRNCSDFCTGAIFSLADSQQLQQANGRGVRCPWLAVAIDTSVLICAEKQEDSTRSCLKGRRPGPRRSTGSGSLNFIKPFRALVSSFSERMQPVG